MKAAAAKIKSLAIDIATISVLITGAIALATHAVNATLPSLF